MNNEQLHRDLGRVESEVKGLRRDVSTINGKLDDALAYIERQKGARRATIALSAGAASVVGTVAGLFASWFVK